MTVSELIEALKAIPGDHDLRIVVIRTDDDPDENTDTGIERVTLAYGVAVLEPEAPLRIPFEPWVAPSGA